MTMQGPVLILFFLEFITASHVSVISEDHQTAKLSLLLHQSTHFDFITQASMTTIQYQEQDLLTYADAELIGNMQLVLDGTLRLASFENKLIFNDLNQPTLYYLEDFQNQFEGWNDMRTSTCGTSNNKILGGPCQFSNKAINKQFQDLPAHEQLLITFNFHFLDDWNGEYANLAIDNSIVWQENYNWCEKVMPWMCMKFGINVCGNETPDQFGQFYKVRVPHSDSTLTLEFLTSLGKKDACQASWGIDNLSIYLF